MAAENQLLTRRSTFIQMMILVVDVTIAGVVAESAWAVDYDDAAVTSVQLAASPVDMTGSGSFYSDAAVSVACAYQYKNTGSGKALPWLEAKLFVVSGNGMPLVFHTAKSCIGSSCVAKAPLPGIGVGKGTIGCMLTAPNDNHLDDANPGNNEAKVIAAFVPRPGTPSGTSSGMGSYDDVEVVAVQLAAKPTDTAGVKGFYEDGVVNVACVYSYKNTGSGKALPWVDARLYVVSTKGVPLVFHSKKACLSSFCTTEAKLPKLATGQVKIGCRLDQQNTNHLDDANPANNQSEVFATVIARPVTLIRPQPSVPVQSPVSGGTTPTYPIRSVVPPPAPRPHTPARMQAPAAQMPALQAPAEQMPAPPPPPLAVPVIELQEERATPPPSRSR